MTAAATGDMEGLLMMLAPDATWTTDSGGKVKAIRRPVVGAKKVARVNCGDCSIRRIREGASCVMPTTWTLSPSIRNSVT